MTLRSRLEKDFKNFLFLIWKYLGLPSPTPVQYDIADYLQDSTIKRKIIEAFRGVGKSWITSAYVLWRLYRDPDYKALVVSASKLRATDFTTFVKRLINEIPILNYLQPKDSQRDSVIAFDVAPAKPAHAPSVKSVGIFGQLTGSRATEIIGDDIETLQNSQTEDMREKLLKATDEFEAIIVPDVGAITMLGTPQTEETIYDKAGRGTYEKRIWTARYPTIEEAESLYRGTLAPKLYEALKKDPLLAGKPTDPTRFNELDLVDREAAYGRSQFRLQYMLDTSLSDQEKYPLKLKDLIVFACNSDNAPVILSWGASPKNIISEYPNVGFAGDRFYEPFYVDKEWKSYDFKILTVDPSGRGADETGVAIVGTVAGYVYILYVNGFKGYEETTLIKIAELSDIYKVNKIVVETNFGDGMFKALLQPVINRIRPCPIEERRATVQKERRIISALEPPLTRHKLVISRTVIDEDLKQFNKETSYSFLYQFTRLTHERGALKHDDRLDAVAIGVQECVDFLSQDERKVKQRLKDQKFREHLRKFMQHVVGKGYNNNPKWI